LSYVVIAFGVDSQPEFLACLSTDAGAKPVVTFSAGVPVTQGTIVIGVGEALPGDLYSQWLTPANGWWIAMANISLPNSQPSWGSSVDSLQFSLGPSIAPSG
jgi:hypothetical protein